MSAGGQVTGAIGRKGISTGLSNTALKTIINGKVNETTDHKLSGAGPHLVPIITLINS